MDYEVGVLDTQTAEIICDCQGSAERIVALLNELSNENEQLKKRVDNLQNIAAEFGATLVMNGFDIEFDGKDLREMINDD